MKTYKAIAVVLALPILLAACSRFSETSFGYYSQAEKYYSEGKFEKAIDAYEDYLKQEPQGNMAIISHYYIAKSQAAMGKTGEAEKGFNEIIKKYPSSNWAKFSKDQLEQLAVKTA